MATASNSLGDLQAGILAQIGRLSSPTTESLAESDFNAAAANLGSGVPSNSAFGQNRRLVLRDSEQRARLKEAAALLDPSLNRASQEAQAAADREAALQRLNISEGGESSRQASQLANALKMQGIEGEQAMQRLLTGQTGDERLQKLRNAEDIKKLILGAYLNPKMTTQPATPAQPERWEGSRDPFSGISSARLVSPAFPASPERIRPLSNINTLLAQYGIQNPLDLREYGN